MARKRRGRGEGSIFQRKDGTWGARLALGYGADGKRKSRTVYAATKREVQEKLQALQQSAAAGTLSEPNKLTVSQFLAGWMETTAAQNMAASSVCRYRTVIQHHIDPHIGGVKLANVSPATVRQLHADLRKAERSVSTIEMAHKVLCRALKTAAREGTISRNPCDLVDRPRKQASKVEPLTGEQIQALLRAAAGDRQENLIRVALATGCRQGELLALTWADIELPERRLTIRRTVQRVGSALTLAPPKSAAGTRTISLPQMAVDALQDQRKRLMAEGMAGCDLVFPNLAGNLQQPTGFYKSTWHPIRKRAGLPNARFHDLRHAAATAMLTAGVSPRVAQARMGHSSVSITLGVYSHIMPGVDEDAAARIDAAFSPSVDNKLTNGGSAGGAAG